MRKVYKLFTIATILINATVGVHNSDNANTIQLDFDNLFTNDLAFMIGTVMRQLATKNRDGILRVLLFAYTIHSAFCKSGSHVLGKDTHVPVVPLCLCCNCKTKFNCLFSGVTCELTCCKVICKFCKCYPGQALSVWTTVLGNLLDSECDHGVVSETHACKEFCVTCFCFCKNNGLFV